MLVPTVIQIIDLFHTKQRMVNVQFQINHLLYTPDFYSLPVLQCLHRKRSIFSLKLFRVFNESYLKIYPVFILPPTVLYNENLLILIICENQLSNVSVSSPSIIILMIFPHYLISRRSPPMKKIRFQMISGHLCFLKAAQILHCFCLRYTSTNTAKSVLQNLSIMIATCG